MTARDRLAALAARLRAALADEKQRVNLLVCMGLAGLLLLAVSSWLPADSSTQSATPAAMTDSTADYAAELETRLTALISRVEGAGKTAVMVTLESGSESIYATDTDSDGNSTHVLLGSGGADGLVETVETPRVLGVAVVCEGGGSAAVQSRVTALVQASAPIISPLQKWHRPTRGRNPMKQLSAKLKSRGATAVVLTLALGAAVYLNWSFSREAPPSLVVSDTAGEAVETSAQAAEPITDPLVLETAAGADTQMMSAEETANKNYGEAQLVSVNKDSGTEFFESARLTRSKARDEALDTLKKSLKDTKLTSEEKEQLTTQLSDRISNITLETKLETLIKSKGFTDCVVNLEGSKANVTVMTESDALNAEEVTRIRDALLSQCKGLTAQDITIVEVK
mgnify:CR=1 FL=1